MPGTERLFAYPHGQTSVLHERGVILPPVVQAVCGLASLPSHTLRLTSSPPARLFVQQSLPTIENGDLVLVNHGIHKIIGDAIYAKNMDGKLYIKQVKNAQAGQS